jgi:hypothetical protein
LERGGRTSIATTSPTTSQAIAAQNPPAIPRTMLASGPSSIVPTLGKALWPKADPTTSPPMMQARYDIDLGANMMHDLHCNLAEVAPAFGGERGYE